MVLQYPVDGAAEATILMKAARSISPAANLSRAFQTTVPEPIRLPSAQALSMGPTDKAIGGNIDGCRGHQAGGRGFVATGREHDPSIG